MEIGGIRFVMPLADIAAVIEPTTMEARIDDPHGIWIGHVYSQQGVIAVASGSALMRTANRAIPAGRIAILRGDFPVGLAVDRMLSARTINRSEMLDLPGVVPALQTCPVTAAFWGEGDQLELLLDRKTLIDELDADLLGPGQMSGNRRYSQQKMLDRYSEVDYQRGLEVLFNNSQERWVLPMSAVRLVTDARPPHPLPRTPEKVTGLVSWQRNPIPVIDPSSVLDLPNLVGLPAKFIVIGEPVKGGQTSVQADAAILVDRVAGIHNILRLEHGSAWDSAGDALNLFRITDVLA
jgi:chemotaxis signal transduction protein